MLEQLIVAICVIALFTFGACIMLYPPGFLIWLPSVVVAWLFISTCIVIVPAPYTPPPDSWSSPDDGSYGYTSDHYLLPPGYEGFKWPWITVDIYAYDYTSIDTEIPTQTADGMRLIYNVDTPTHSLRFDPIKFDTLYDHNVSHFNQAVINSIKPHLDAYMSTISEADFELGNMDHEQLELDMIKYYPQAGLDWSEGPKYVTYFSHVDNPQFNYACSGVGSGYCSMGDQLGLPRASNDYQGQPIPYLDRNPITTPTPDPTPIYMSDGGYETQSEVDASIEQFLLEHPELA